MIHINTECYSQGFKQVAPLQNDKGYIAYWKAKAKLSFLGENKPKKCFARVTIQILQYSSHSNISEENNFPCVHPVKSCTFYNYTLQLFIKKFTRDTLLKYVNMER